jgi:hypothetical protein
MVLELTGEMESRIESQYLGNLAYRSGSVSQKVLGFVETDLQLILFGTEASSRFEYLPKIRVTDLQFLSELLHEDRFVIAASDSQLSFLNLFVDRPAKVSLQVMRRLQDGKHM